MEWIFENLGKLAPLALFLFYLLSALKGSKREEEEEQVDPEAADRARRIQEEIRRKILERQKGESSDANRESGREMAERQREVQPPVEEPEPYNPFVPERPPERRFEPRVEPVFTPQQRSEEAILLENQRLFEEQQRQIQEKLQKAKELREAALVKQRETYERPTSHVTGSEIGNELIRDFKDVSSLRRAIVAKEILDKPVGMR